MKKTFRLIWLFFLFASFILKAQVHPKTWRNIIFNSNKEWFASSEAKEIAENVLLYQKDFGGWPKNIEMQKQLSPKEIEKLTQEKKDPAECTIDNGATTQEMIFLSKIYQKQPDERYKNAFLRGLMYLISAQYKNGGWPQFYPLREGYYSHITYNDDAMVNVLNLFKVIKEKGAYYSISVPEEIVQLASTSFDKGIDCILKTQYRQNGILTAWCAQHDEETLEPAKARAFELISLSGKESAGVTLLLMSIDKPSKDIINAVDAAVKWFEKTKITGIKLISVPTGNGNETNRVVIESQDAEPLWARFMNLEDNKPFFCDRSGIKKSTLAEISFERRNGYGWYSTDPKEVLNKYPKWKASLTK